MMSHMEIRTVVIPENVKVNLEGKTVKTSGKKGKLKKDFSHAHLLIQLNGNKVIVKSIKPKRKESALVGTVCSHIRNMIIGVTNGFTYKLKIVYTHFPISAILEGNRIVIKNFIGERNPRVAKIVGDTKIIVKDDDILVQGINIEEVSQTAANIEQAMKVKEKDPRKFLDGIYFYEKTEGIID